MQILRAVAAGSVIVCHVYEPAKVGAFGVDLFFVISGFIITLAMRRRSAGEFLRDRVLRIYPIYWICSVPAVLVAAQVGALTLPRTMTSMTLWPVFQGFLQPYLVLGWTLSFEMLFYLCATLALLDRRSLPILAVAYPTALLGSFLTGSALLRFIGNPIIIEFLMGVAIASRYPFKQERWAVGGLAIAAAVLLLCVSAADRLQLPRNVFELGAPERALTWGIPAALIVWGTLQLEKLTKRFRFLAYLGDASYSIYLTHGIGTRLFLFLPWPFQVAGAMAFGTGVYRYVEAPMQDFFRRQREMNSLAEHCRPVG